MNLAFNEDEFIDQLMNEKREALWRAELSNGKVAIQDDGRPGLEQPSAWLRLKEYCVSNSVNIERFWLQFRSNRIDELKPKAEGYFFSKGILRSLDSSDCLHFFLIGQVEGSSVHILKYSVPELICIERMTRPLEGMTDTIIKNKPLTHL